MSSSAATGIAETAATINGNITSDGGTTITERGFVYKTSAGVTITDNKTVVSGTTGAYSLNLSSLGVNSQYFFKAYAINSVGTTLSSELNFYTLANLPGAPTVGNPTASTLDVAIGSGDGNPATTQYAIQETGGLYVQANGSLGAPAVFQTSSTWGTVTVTGLLPTTTYTFQVKARNGANVETGFGSTTGGTTAFGVVAPGVSTQPADSFTTTGATLHGTVVSDGGDSLTDRGFYWSATPGVTTSSTQLSEGGTTVAAFAAPLTGLSVNTIYYYRAYAVNSVGTGIGASDVSFYTLANAPLAPTVNNPTPNRIDVALSSGDGNPGGTLYAIQETTSGNYVQSDGSLGAVAVYKTFTGWGTTTVTGLSANTAYSFQVKAQNGGGVDTAFGPTGSGTTQPTPLAAWDFTGAAGTEATIAASIFNANLDSANTVTRGTGAAGSTAGNSFRTTGFQNNGISTANTDYFQETLSAVSGYTLSLATIDARFAGTSTFRPVTGQFAWSTNGTTFNLIGSPFVMAADGAMPQIDLSGIPGLQNVLSARTVTIRYYASGQTTTGAWGYNSPSSGTYGIRFGGTLTACTDPTAYSVTGGGAYCAGDVGVVVGLANSETGVSYQLYRSGGSVVVGTPVAGSSGSPISFGLQTAADTYTVVATRDSGGCVASMSGSAVVTINTLPTITTTSLPNVPIGASYSAAVSATGGSSPYTWSISAGALPSGLSINPGSGIISGTYSGAAGSSTFTVKALNNGNTCYTEKEFTVNMIVCPTITLSGSAPVGTVGTAYSATTFSASGGTSPYTFSFTGTLPTGLTLSTGGVLSGTPTVSGTFNFTVIAVDADGCSGVLPQSVVVSCPTITISGTPPSIGLAGTAIPSTTFTATGGTAPYTWDIASGSLPAGLTLSSGGVLSGTPTVTGFFNYTVRATGVYGCTGLQSKSITINCGTITVAPATLPNGSVGKGYAQTVTASGGVAPYSFAVTSGTLPLGLTLASGGGLTGTPTIGGTYSFTVTATSSAGCTSSQAYTVQVAVGSSSLVISQIYGGGGNVYDHDYIVIFNRSCSSVNVAGWSVQYAASGGTSWTPTALSGSIPPGSYYLVAEALTAGGTTLPAADASGTINMSATAGKVALCNSTTALSGATPSSSTIIDLVGYGSAASIFEGSGPTPAPSSTTSVQRKNTGCTDTDNNAADFVAAAPFARNSATSANLCGPTAAISGDATICSGGTATITITLSGQGPWTYTYTDGTTPTTRTAVGGNGQSGNDSFSVNPTLTSTYTVTSVTDSGACANPGSTFGSATITVNPLPVANNASYDCTPGLSVAIRVQDHAPTATSVISTTTPAHGNVTVLSVAGEPYFYYWNNGTGTSDSFDYTINNGQCTSASATITLNLSGPNSQSQNKLSEPEPLGDGTVRLKFLTIPNYTYALEWTHDLTPIISWVALVTNTADGTGLVTYTNTPSNLPGGDYYRTRWVP